MTFARYFSVITALLALLLSLPLVASAQTYPSRPVTLVVPFPAGGSTDWLSRLLGQKTAIPYKGNAPGLQDVVAGHVSVMFSDLLNSRGSIAITTPPPDELKRYVESEIVRWGKVVEQAGAKGTE
jgi:tripartite-type tricarboxylate transporter receptor subunit TctC